VLTLKCFSVKIKSIWYSIIFFIIPAFFTIIPSLSDLSAGEFRNALSFQGYTGLLHTPNAEISDEGKIYFLFSDHVERTRRDRESAENYMLSLGLLPYLELGGRLTEEHPSGLRDLSANVKFKVPFFHKRKYLPELAFGIQDIGGGAKHFSAKYAVITKEIWPLRFSLGYGADSDRMEGIFGGAEIQLFDWLFLLGEYDTSETNLGVRLLSPENLFGLPVDIGITATTSLDHRRGNFDIAAMLHVPLGVDYHNTRPLTGRPENKRRQPLNTDITFEGISPNTERSTAPIPAVLSAQGEPGITIADSVGDSLRELKRELIELGFENLKVGIKNQDTLFVEYENNRYNHNEIDGLGLLLGVVAVHEPAQLDPFIVVMKKMNIPMLELRSSILAYRDFLFNLDSSVLRRFTKIRTSISTYDYEGIEFIGGDSNPSRFKPRLVLYPGLRTFVGTEVGAFDYLLSVKPDVFMNFWKGGVFNARWDIPVEWSGNFENGKSFRHFRESAHLERLMVHQAYKITPDIMMLFSAGMYIKDNTGLLNETIWGPGTGKHRFRVRLGYLEDSDRDLKREIYLGSYRYYIDQLDLYVEGTYGKYFYQDKGITIDVKRFFGDTSITMFYKYTGDNEGQEAAGIRISFPLTPRRDMKPSFAQIRGADSWSYQLQSTVASEGEFNPVNTNIAVIPQMFHNLEHTYYNRDRLSEVYIKNNLFRLRDAYLRWGRE
jgi:hypothetical protein